MTTGDRTNRARRDEQPAAAEQEAAEQKARDICVRLLTARPRTRVELAQVLTRKGIPDQLAERVLGKLDRSGLVNDADFAETWVHSRHTYDGLGRRALIAELKRKGVDESVAAEAASEVDSAAEERRARQLVRKKLRTVGDAEEATRVRRLVGVLARKGYPQGLAYRVVREELRAAGEDGGLLDDVLID